MTDLLLTDMSFQLIIWVISLVLVALAAYTLGYYLGKKIGRQDDAFYNRPDRYADRPRINDIPW